MKLISSFPPIIWQILFALMLMGLFLFAANLALRRLNHPSSAVAALYWLLAIGIPMFFIENAIFSAYSLGKAVTYACMGITLIIIYFIAFVFLRRIANERKAERERRNRR